MRTRNIILYGRRRCRYKHEAVAQGVAIAKDTKEAVRWYRMAADTGGMRGAQNNLGFAYNNWRRRCQRHERGGALVSQGGGAGTCGGAK